MKVKKLIELLQEFNDDDEVCMPTEDGNVDIFCLEQKEGYWDGVFQVLERDWTKTCYNIVGAKYRSDGWKIVIQPHSIQDALIDNPNLPIEVIDGFVDKKMQKRVDEWRQSAKKIIADVDKWAKEKKKEERR